MQHSSSVRSGSLGDLPNLDAIQTLEPVRRIQPFRSEGTVTVHLPAFDSIEVEYNRREPIEAFRARLQTLLPNVRIADYLVVCDRGSITDGTTLDHYYLTPGADVILVRKGIGNRQQLLNRAFWLKSHDSAVRGEPRPMAKLIAEPKSHRPTPFRVIIQRPWK
jgi:hypothetical protein